VRLGATLSPLSIEDLKSSSFVRTEQELEELWFHLRRQKPRLDAFLISHNPYEQPITSLVVETFGIPFDYAEPIIGDIARRLWNYLWAIFVKIPRLQIDYGKSSYGILNSIKTPGPRHWEYPWAIEHSNLSGKMSILDVGCGFSLFPMYLAKRGLSVTAIDLDSVETTMLSPFLAGLVAARVDYQIGNAVELDFPDNTFDRVYCISVLEHIEEEKRNGRLVNYHKRSLDVIAIGQMLRVLKPGGLLVITVDWSENPNNFRSYRLHDITTRLVEPFRRQLVSRTLPRVAWSVYSARVWKLYQERYPFYTEEQLRLNPDLDAAAFGIVMRKPS
jgi:2-polyprenyl-3-methyl-5-hydroxy-6-metoxy-1,4-benzoquinol methylase